MTKSLTLPAASPTSGRALVGAAGQARGPVLRVRVRRLLAAIGLSAVVLALSAVGLTAPASAHEGPGILTVETDEPTPTGHHYVIRLVWENDGHPAARDTTITATPFAPDGAPQTPIAMTPVDDDGRFEATVEMTQPGAWRIQFTSVSPVATVDHPVEVAAPTTTSTTATTTTAEEGEDSAASGSGSEEETAADPTASRASDEDDDSSGGAIALIVIAIGVVAALAIAGYSILRRRGTAAGSTDRPSPTSPSPTAGDGADPDGGSDATTDRSNSPAT
jgi:hypothetical protein